MMYYLVANARVLYADERRDNLVAQARCEFGLTLGEADRLVAGETVQKPNVGDLYIDEGD